MPESPHATGTGPHDTGPPDTGSALALLARALTDPDRTAFTRLVALAGLAVLVVALAWLVVAGWPPDLPSLAGLPPAVIVVRGGRR